MIHHHIVIGYSAYPVLLFSVNCLCGITSVCGLTVFYFEKDKCLFVMTYHIYLTVIRPVIICKTCDAVCMQELTCHLLISGSGFSLI